MKIPLLFLGAVLGLTLSNCSSSKTVAPPIEVKVMVMVMFDPEARTWLERRNMTTSLPFPAGFSDIRTDGKGVFLTITGEGKSNAAGTVMALGLDPRFDFSHTYWIIAGIGGVDPVDASIGSAVWADYIIDGDLSHVIDLRETPKDWTTGYFPLGRDHPYAQPLRIDMKDFGIDMVYTPNRSLVEWAYQLTKDVPLEETDGMKQKRRRYTATPAAMEKPKVMIGATLTGDHFWHGKYMNTWANDWVSYWTEGKANYVTTAMEDTASFQSLTRLAKAGRMDLQRVLVLRTASNFDSQPPGLTAAQNIQEDASGNYSAFIPSLHAAYDVGNKVVTEILNHWITYRDRIPAQ